MREAEIDVVIKDLVSLKDGQNDDLGKILTPAIALLKDFRKQRFSMRQLMGQLGAILNYSKNNIKLVEDLRKISFGKKR